MNQQTGNKHLFCFGYGYCGEYLTDFLSRTAPGWEVSGTTRDVEKRQVMREKGIKAFLFDQNQPLADPLYMMRDATHILISTPPNSEGDPSFRMHAKDLVQLPKLEWVGYLSTIGAYGDRNGEWVDETSQPRPTTKRGSRRHEAEENWLSLLKFHDVPMHIFRLAGIYGPGRSALDSIRSGVARRIDKPGHAFSRCHIDDIVQVLMASMMAPKPGEIYNICDDLPTPSHEVIEHACNMLNVEPPPLIHFDDVHISPIARSFYKDNKRVRNDKIKNDLGVNLKHPTYKEGLQACLDSERKAAKKIIPGIF